MLRVIAGKYKGRKLEQPPFNISRPTSDRTKEAIFSMIQFQIDGSIVLDLFAGSGAISLEAASRGATKCIAVDNNNEAIKVMKSNIDKVAAGNITVVKSNVLDFLKRSNGMKFDFIFMDPPYKEIKLYSDVLKQIKNLNLLKERGLIIVETSAPEQIDFSDDFVVQKHKKYGKSNILLLANNI